jgi:E3 ubiquitin-protein ligase RNF115/126
MPTRSSWQNTPPTRKKAVAAMPTVRVRGAFICYLDEVAVGGRRRTGPIADPVH